MTARTVSKHRRVCGQNYGQIPVLAQKKSPVTGMVTGLFTGAVGGIRTLVPLLTTTRFPVVLVMTSSIPLHIRFADKQHGLLYQKYQVCQDGIFGVSCGIDSKYLSQHNV